MDCAPVASDRLRYRRVIDATAVAIGGVALATAAISALDGLAPVVSLGVLYVLPVLFVATRYGVVLASATALLSVLAFNWFHLPPTGRLLVSDSRHWAVLGVLLVVAVVSARIAEHSRMAGTRAEAARAEADLIAALTRAVLLGTPVSATLDEAAGQLATHLGVPATIVPWSAGTTEDSGSVLLLGSEGPVAVLRWHGALDPEAEAVLRSRTAPALAAAVAAGVQRERLAREAVEAEAFRRSNEVATTLLRTVGHDLRTPLTQISAAAAALRSSTVSDEERDDLAAGISEGSERLADMLGKLLDLSRLEAGASAPQPHDIPLDDVVHDALQDMASTHPGAALVRVDVEDPPPRARVDPVQIQRIIANLVENALVHGHDPVSGKTNVFVRITSRRGRSVVRVVDGGRGLPATGRDELFLPFKRGVDPAGPGSGLGLAIAHGFAVANDGTLRAESYPGQGTAFILELPPALCKDETETTVGGTGSRPVPGPEGATG